MKKQHKHTQIILLLLLSLLIPTNIVMAQQPAYAEWGKVAVEETTKQFPDQEVVDYLYEGRVVISNRREQYNFKMTLESADKKRKQVRVYVVVNPRSNKVVDVHFDEL